MSDAEWMFHGALELAQMVRSGEVSSRELVQCSLDRIEELDPTLVYPGHHGLIENAAERAAEIREHHHERLDVTEQSLRDGATTPDDVLVAIWGRKLTKHEHRFAYGEAVSHLVRLERLGRAHEFEPGYWRAA